ncbi:hypothetical protein [Paraburkholderia sp. RAU2J]|uniref:hypothetical protein n=1 Tax=Paraburkholderia sp. RAU2J TaxID=1938810 RepID=UPI0011C38B71|nr:hypothetical protein [Paraburkholderia sp. RAU2J]
MKMSNSKLSDEQLAKLRPLEKRLEQAVREAESELAVEIATEIQALFPNDRAHHRLLQAKLWAFEACVDANRLTYAETGLIGVRKLSNPDTRLYLEASSLLAICLLRLKKVDDSKKLIKEVVSKLNNIKSDRTRHRFQKIFVERIEEECVFAELIGFGDQAMNPAEIQAKAVFLLQHSSDDEIFKFIGNSVPVASLNLLSDVRSFSVKQLPAADRKLLPAPEKAAEPKQIGRTTFALLRRIAWKTFCKPSSPIYVLWSKKVPKVFNEGYFSAAVVTTMGDFKIGVPLLASGIAALTMKYSAEEFCALAKPKGLMSDRTEK